MKVKAKKGGVKDWDVKVNPDLNKHAGANYAPQKSAAAKKFKAAILAGVSRSRSANK